MATILLVDDDPDVLSILSLTLSMAGHDIIPASSGIAALGVLENKVYPDLLLTDVVMPGLSGFNLARMAHERAPFMKVIYLTGYHEKAMVLRGQGEKIGKMLTKPILPDDLTQEVDQMLQTKTA